MEDKTSLNEKEKETPEKPEQEGAQTPPEEKTPDEETRKQIESLQAQKEHWRKKAEEAAEEAAKLKLQKETSTPSEQELSTRYPDWDLLDEAEKVRLKREEEREKRLRRLEEDLAWERDFKSLVRKDEFKILSEAESEFHDFAYKYPREVDLEVLAASYLYRKGMAGKPEPSPAPGSRKGLEKPTGGHGKIVSTELTPEDLERLRREQPKTYEKMLREGRLDKVKFQKDEE